MRQFISYGTSWKPRNSSLNLALKHCGVKCKWNCTACRGNDAFRGFDCEIAPRVCSEYPPNTYFKDTWVIMPVWPWGIYRPSINVWCRNTYETLLIFSYGDGSTRVLRGSFRTGFEFKTTDVNNHTSTLAEINWPLLSELQSLAKNKILNVHVMMDSSQTNYLYQFGGLELSPLGELSINVSLNGSTGFPIPLNKAPFVLWPPGYGPYCGPFWRFVRSVPVCKQRTKLLNFRNCKWDGANSSFPDFLALTFT